MDGGDFSSDDRTFKLSFTAEGVATLKDRINDKLKEFMGEYTDDTLVDYVIVLLRNGRRKVEVAKELHVFLGDDNLSFISWLWDHLSSNLQLYVEQPSAPSSKLKRGPYEEKEKVEGKTVKRPRRDSSLLEENVLNNNLEKESKEAAKRQKIVWEEREKRDERERVTVVERVRESERSRFPLRSVVTSVLNKVSRGDREATNNLRAERRRVREDDQQQIKRDQPSRMAVDAPRRLIEFAVRDAVKPVRDTPPTTQQPGPSMNRLRSVLSMPASEAMQEKDEFGGEEEEVEDEEGNYSISPCSPAQRAQSCITAPGGSSRMERSSVFDRLGRNRSEMGISHTEFEEKHSSDSASDNDGYDLEYSVAQEKEAEVVRNAAPVLPASQVGSKPSKILNISVNVNTWKPPGVVQETHSFSLQNNKLSKAESSEVNIPATVPKVLSKTSTPAASRTLEDPDSRTLFVSNVHFGATKDALSRHFNKFGAVLKVIILTDVNSGQPMGSAYVEFLQKESAEAALALNGTSFMSRILKVVKKSSQVPGWAPARGAHTSSFPPRPAVRPPYPLRARAPVRGGGARSLQWKRQDQSSDTSSNAPVAVTSAATTPTSASASRSFTYTRVPPKTPGQSRDF